MTPNIPYLGKLLLTVLYFIRKLISKFTPYQTPVLGMCYPLFVNRYSVKPPRKPVRYKGNASERFSSIESRKLCK